jgi:hypothetical protein
MGLKAGKRNASILNNTLKKTLKNLLYALPIALASFLPMKEVKAQYNSPINLFEHPIASAYDTLKTKAERDAYVLEWLKKDFVDGIPGLYPGFDCTEYSNLLSVDAYGTTSPTAFWGYNGNNLDTIYIYGGTLKYNGDGKLPIISIEITTGVGHEMNGIYTGDDLKWKSFCAIEPQFDWINVQPGEGYIPKDCEIYIRGTPLPGNIPINSPCLIKYKIINGNVSEPLFEAPFIWPDDAKWLIKYRDSIHNSLENKIYESQIEVYPNPVKDIGRFKFSNKKQQEVYLEIYDISGRAIGKKSDNDEEIEFDFSNFSPGIYLYKIGDFNGNFYTGKLVKE